MGDRIEFVQLALSSSSSIELSTTPLLKVGLTEEIVIVYGNLAHVLIGLHVLNVGFDDRRVAADRGDFVVLARDHAVDGLIDRRDRS